MKVVIVESPAKCKKIESYLGPGYKCIASYGHITELTSLSQIDTKKQFTPTFSPCKEKKKQIAMLRKETKAASEVILATDDDREGEAIAWHICQICKLNINKTKRILFHEITKPAILAAIENPLTIRMNIVQAQQARQILDLCVGFKISPLLWKHIAHGMSAGRCQTPALNLVYENDKADRKEKMVYDVFGYFTSKHIKFTLKDNLEDPQDFLEKCKTHTFIYNFTCPKPIVKNPPKPLITSTIQQKANNVYHYSPKQTMACCQKLYEGGHITYMRTDSCSYSKEFIANAKKNITKKWGKEFIHSSISRLETNQGKSGQEAHEAIRPTHIENESVGETFSPQERNMYKLIWTHTMESCMAPAEGQKISATISAPDNKEFYYDSELIVFMGWLIVQNKPLETHYAFLQQIKKGPIQYKKINAQQTMKGGKTHLSEAQLIQQLEKKNIGRPSTFSSIVEKIKTKGYVKKMNVEGKTLVCKQYELLDNTLKTYEEEKTFQSEKNKLVLQPEGEKVIQFCYQYFEPLFNYQYTETMEEKLDQIVRQGIVWHEICKECYDLIDSLSGGVDAPMKPSQTSREIGTYQNKQLFVKKGRFGYYAQWGDNKVSLSMFGDIHIQDIELSHLITYLDKKDSNVLRVLNADLSIRKSKYGQYIYYKTSSMKKPCFLKLAKFKGDPLECNIDELVDWIKSFHKI